MTSDRETALESIRREACAGDWVSLWTGVMRTRLGLLELLERIPAKDAERRAPGEGEAGWSAAEVARHVLAYTENVGAIIEATARGQTVVKDPPGTLRPEATDYSALVRLVGEASMKLAALPSRLPPEPNLETTVVHAFFGPLNCREWFAFLRLHDADHARQLRRLLGA